MRLGIIDGWWDDSPGLRPCDLFFVLSWPKPPQFLYDFIYVYKLVPANYGSHFAGAQRGNPQASIFANHNLGWDDSFLSSRTQYFERSVELVVVIPRKAWLTENRKIPAVKLSPVRPWPLWLWSMLHVKMVMVLMQSDGFRCNTENCKSL